MEVATDSPQAIPVGPSYQLPLARVIKQAVSVPVIGVGLITDFDHAEAAGGTGDADAVALASGMLYDPRWPWHAAAYLGAQWSRRANICVRSPASTAIFLEAVPTDDASPVRLIPSRCGGRRDET